MRHKLQPEFDLDGPARNAAEIYQPATVSGVQPAGPTTYQRDSLDAQNLETLSRADGNPRIHDAEIEW